MEVDINGSVSVLSTGLQVKNTDNGDCANLSDIQQMEAPKNCPLIKRPSGVLSRQNSGINAILDLDAKTSHQESCHPHLIPASTQIVTSYDQPISGSKGHIQQVAPILKLSNILQRKMKRRANTNSPTFFNKEFFESVEEEVRSLNNNSVKNVDEVEQKTEPVATHKGDSVEDLEEVLPSKDVLLIESPPQELSQVSSHLYIPPKELIQTSKDAAGNLNINFTLQLGQLGQKLGVGGDTTASHISVIDPKAFALKVETSMQTDTLDLLEEELCDRLSATLKSQPKPDNISRPLKSCLKNLNVQRSWETCPAPDAQVLGESPSFTPQHVEENFGSMEGDFKLRTLLSLDAEGMHSILSSELFEPEKMSEEQIPPLGIINTASFNCFQFTTAPASSAVNYYNPQPQVDELIDKMEQVAIELQRKEEHTEIKSEAVVIEIEADINGNTIIDPEPFEHQKKIKTKAIEKISDAISVVDCKDFHSKEPFETTTEEGSGIVMSAINNALEFTGDSISTTFSILANIVPYDNEEPDEEVLNARENDLPIKVMSYLGVPRDIRHNVYNEACCEVEVLQDLMSGSYDALATVFKWVCGGEQGRQDFLDKTRKLCSVHSEVDWNSDVWTGVEQDILGVGEDINIPMESKCSTCPIEEKDSVDQVIEVKKTAKPLPPAPSPLSKTRSEMSANNPKSSNSLKTVKSKFSFTRANAMSLIASTTSVTSHSRRLSMDSLVTVSSIPFITMFQDQKINNAKETPNNLELHEEEEEEEEEQRLVKSSQSSKTSFGKFPDYQEEKTKSSQSSKTSVAFIEEKQRIKSSQSSKTSFVKDSSEKLEIIESNEIVQEALNNNSIIKLELEKQANSLIHNQFIDKVSDEFRDQFEFDMNNNEIPNYAMQYCSDQAPPDASFTISEEDSRYQVNPDIFREQLKTQNLNFTAPVVTNSSFVPIKTIENNETGNTVVANDFRRFLEEVASSRMDN